MLAAENAELDSGWKEAMRDLERSRTRLVRAADDERRKFERDLHDGVQQQLVAIRIWLELAAEATVDGATRDRLIDIGDNVEGALEEVRAVSHGIYPQVLSDSGLVAALQSIQRRTPVPLSLDADGVGRYSPEVESAVYYSCLEAIQNATKHGGHELHISVTLRQDGDQFQFDVEETAPDSRPNWSPGPASRTWKTVLALSAAVLRCVALPARARWSPGACRGPLVVTREGDHAVRRRWNQLPIPPGGSRRASEFSPCDANRGYQRAAWNVMRDAARRDAVGFHRYGGWRGSVPAIVASRLTGRDSASPARDVVAIAEQRVRPTLGVAIDVKILRSQIAAVTLLGHPLPSIDAPTHTDRGHVAAIGLDRVPRPISVPTAAQKNANSELLPR